MKFRPEADNDRTEGIPSAPAGEHVMRISSWIEDRQTKNGTKDLVEFVGEIPYDGEIVMVGTTMWISHPEGGKKGNLWKYRQLADALGDDALEQYRAKDKGGFSMFNPIELEGSSRDRRSRSVRHRGGATSRQAAEPHAGVASANRGQLGQV
jgi:hypothetical protein